MIREVYSKIQSISRNIVQPSSSEVAATIRLDIATASCLFSCFVSTLLFYQILVAIGCPQILNLINALSGKIPVGERLLTYQLPFTAFDELMGIVFMFFLSIWIFVFSSQSKANIYSRTRSPCKVARIRRFRLTKFWRTLQKQKRRSPMLIKVKMYIGSARCLGQIENCWSLSSLFRLVELPNYNWEWEQRQFRVL